MGWFNRKSHKARNKRYNQRIKEGSFDRNKEDHLVIVAEGDSWFQFPVFIKDIIDWLTIRNPHYAIYSIAFAGDWLTNMIYEGKYIEELSIHAPDVFLLSAGGNDLVGSNRIALMVDLNAGYPKYKTVADIPNLDEVNDQDKAEIFEIQSLINKEFYSFLLVLELQYRKIISSINNKYKDMMVITHGYDFSIPSYSRAFDIRYPLKSLVNGLIDTGKWLIRPMRIKGIYEPEIQRKIIKALIFELNVMLYKIAIEGNNFYYVNALKSAKKRNDWFDELHLKSHAYKRVTMVFEQAISNHLSRVDKKASAMHTISTGGFESSTPQTQKVYVVNDEVPNK
jgi:hypothetical protein